jgi:multiple sugar transport system substrate-binding protein
VPWRNGPPLPHNAPKVPRAVLLALIAASALLGPAPAAAVDWAKELSRHPGQVLRMSVKDDPWVDALETLNREFERLTGARVVVEPFDYERTHEREVRVGASGSDYYDVLVVDSPWVGEFARAGYVEDLGPLLARDGRVVDLGDFVPAFQELARWDGKLVGIPFGTYLGMLHYRTDLLQREGVEVPRTIEELELAARILTRTGAPALYGLALNNQRGAPVGQAYFEYVYNFGGRPFRSLYPGSKSPYADMTPLFTSPESLAVVRFFKDLLEVQPPGARNFAWQDGRNAFLSGQVAMIIAWSVETARFAAKGSATAGRFETGPFPARRGVTPVPPLGGWVMSIAHGSRQKDLAWDYIKWFTSPEVHKRFVFLGGPPSRLSTLLDKEVRARLPWVRTLEEVQPTAFADCRPRIPESFEIIDLVGLYVAKALHDQMTVEDAMRQAEREVTWLLAAHGYQVDPAPP